MFSFRAEQWVPKFLLRERNGLAMARAIEAAMQALNDAIARGAACITSVDEMPEWRLDELAWEYDILYDDGAEIDVKREWIRDAMGFYALYGTRAGLVKYLKAVYNDAVVEEWFEYGGDPYHFRISVTGEWSEAANDWAYAVVDRVKNVRSVLDTITFSASGSEAAACAAAAVTDMEIRETSQTTGGLA